MLAARQPPPPLSSDFQRPFFLKSIVVTYTALNQTEKAKQYWERAEAAVAALVAEESRRMKKILSAVQPEEE